MIDLLFYEPIIHQWAVIYREMLNYFLLCYFMYYVTVHVRMDSDNMTGAGKGTSCDGRMGKGDF